MMFAVVRHRSPKLGRRVPHSYLFTVITNIELSGVVTACPPSGRETRELAVRPQAELDELALIYVKRGLERELAMGVAEQLSARDRLGAHLRDELGIDQAFLARPMQAAWISAASFASFAVVPIVALLAAPAGSRISAIAALSLISLAGLGAFGGHLGGAPLGRAALRVTIGGVLAMAVTAAIGRIFGVAMG